jgi:hypothetical protein
MGYDQRSDDRSFYIGAHERHDWIHCGVGCSRPHLHLDVYKLEVRDEDRHLDVASAELSGVDIDWRRDDGHGRDGSRYTASPGNPEWSLHVNASSYSFPKLTTTRGAPGVSGHYRKGLGIGAAGANAFQALATIIGSLRDEYGEGSKYPVLTNVTGSFSLADSSSIWYPELEHVGGDVYVGESGLGGGINSNFVPGNWPPKLTDVKNLELMSYSWDGSPTTLTTISLPIVKCGRLTVDLKEASSVRTLEFPALTDISGTFITFAGTLELTDIKMPVLASLEQYLNFRVTSYSGPPPLTPVPDSTPVTVHVPCTDAMLPILTGYGGGDYAPYCTGCSLCNPDQVGGPGGGPGGPGAPSSSSKLSDAEKAGIAVGCVALATILIIVFVVKRRKNQKAALREQLGIPQPGRAAAPAFPQQPQIIVIQQQPQQ